MENKELFEKARGTNSPEELLALAKENGIELDEKEAKVFFEQLHNSEELSDEELNNVAGGGCGSDYKQEYTSLTCCSCGCRIRKITDRRTGESWTMCGCKR